MKLESDTISKILKNYDLCEYCAGRIISKLSGKSSSKLLGNEKSKQIVFSKIVSIIIFIVGILLLTPEYGVLGLAVSYLLSTIFEALCLIPFKNLTQK